MRRVEQHIINKSSSFYQEIDDAAFASKNLYNLANYHCRQAFFAGERVPRYESLYNRLKTEEAYQALPRKVAQQTLKLVDKAWKSYFESKKAYAKDASKYLAEPRIPGYKDKLAGRYALVYTVQAVSKKFLGQRVIKPSGLNLQISTQQDKINQVRIVPKKTHYVVEVIYTVVPTKVQGLDTSLVAGIDLGVNNLAAVTSNKPGFTPLVVNGRPIKSTNQFYNKRKADLQSQLEGKRHRSHRTDRLDDKRNRRIHHYLHSASRKVIDTLVDEGIGTLVIGLNGDWKQRTNLGKRNNQNFVNIPHARFVDRLCYKAESVGINVFVEEESYTSKTSFLDQELPEKQQRYAGKRIQRGLFKAGDGRLINADVNGSYQIIKKVVPDAFRKGIEDVVVHPVPLFVAVQKSIVPSCT